MAHLTISQLKQNAGATACTATVDVQIQKCVPKTTKSGKPYILVTFVDATDQFSLNIWENLPQYQTVQDLGIEAFIRLEGDWIQNQYGIDGVRWQLRLLNKGEIATFLSGDPETKAVQDKDWQDIVTLTTAISDPRLNALCAIFLSKHGDHFRRTAAARKNHHARRGGLVEHVAQMMRCASAICKVYPKLNFDLMITGVLFHDCGKLWENSYAESGFPQPYDLAGEVLGPIPLGITFVEKLWTSLMASDHTANWAELQPSSDLVRIHLLHLIASHHGTYEFGSPTLPRTPEAHALHHIDNLDAKYEMFKQAYQVSSELAPGIYEKQFPLPANLVAPLQHFENDSDVSDDLEINNDLEVKPFDGELF